MIAVDAPDARARSALSESSATPVDEPVAPVPSDSPLRTTPGVAALIEDGDPRCQTDAVSALVAGFLAGLSLIVAIGAQNAFVLRTGLSRHHVPLVVTICALSDVALIALGVGGLGGIIRSTPFVLQVLRWVGVAYLSYFAVKSFRHAIRPGTLEPATSRPLPRRSVVSTTLALTFLNPHVYLDTVLLLGSIANQYGHSRWNFAIGASAASLAWFSTLGFGARRASRLMSHPMTWRVLESVIGVVMTLIALRLATTRLS